MELKMNKKSLLVAAAAFLMASPILGHAQTATTPTAPQTIGQREKNQQTRIAQGVKSGQLTPRETAKLERQQQGIHREVKGMREANGGKLSKADKAAVRQQQNRASRNIYHKKHNAAKVNS